MARIESGGRRTADGGRDKRSADRSQQKAGGRKAVAGHLAASTSPSAVRRPPSAVASPATLRRLLAQARRAAEHAYAPYSKFPVGAALLLADGHTVFSGCNVENAAYGLSICAERVALASAISAGRRDFRAMAIVCLEGPNPCFPCGSCRQFMAEFGPEMRIVLAGARGQPQVFTVGELLPQIFRLQTGPD